MLIGKNISLQLIEKEDLPLLVEWKNSAYTDFYEYPLSDLRQDVWFKKHIEMGDYLFTITTIDNDTGRFNKIGMIGLSNIDYRNRNAEFGRFVIEEKYRDKGYGKESLKLLLEYAFKHLNLHSVYLDAFIEKKVLSLYEAVGFKREGLKREHIYKDGKYRDIVCMRVLKGDFKCE